jgi:predicted nuclease with TOPRIM domain
MDIEDKQESAARNPEDWEKLRRELLTKIESLEQEYRSVRERLRQVEEENQQFAGRYLEIEEENNNLANLYVASYQLHSTLDLEEVLKIIIEIVINLVGAEVFAVYILDENTG